MAKFKKGDRIKRVKAGDLIFGELGKTYTVIKAGKGWVDIGTGWGADPERFVFAVDETLNPEDFL
jgi:hypothetical protein